MQTESAFSLAQIQPVFHFSRWRRGSESDAGALQNAVFQRVAGQARG